MEFGRTEPALLDAIDFTLPPEPPGNAAVLGGNPHAMPKVYTGLAKWDRPDWAGKIYPTKARPRQYPALYVQQYNSIELNLMHYKIYGPLATAKWAAMVKGRDFKFCPKMYQGVTHKGKLNAKTFLSNEFLRGAAGFGEHLGPVFIQFSETFGPKRKQELFDYLAKLPAGMQYFLELRHKDWFGKPALRQEWLNYLKQLNMGAVITDTAGRRDCVHMELTVPKAFIRFTGNSLHPTDYTRIDAWALRLRHWLQNGLQELYFFMHMHDEAFSPELSLYAIDRLNEVCGLQLEKPKFAETEKGR
jgi:uncharacterized protein YecE (DUF72 family)